MNKIDSSEIPLKFIEFINDTDKDNCIINPNLISFLNNNQLGLIIKYYTNGFCKIQHIKYIKYVFFLNIKTGEIFFNSNITNLTYKCNFPLLNDLFKFIDDNETTCIKKNYKKKINQIINKIIYVAEFLGLNISEDNKHLIIKLNTSVYGDMISKYYLLIDYNNTTNFYIIILCDIITNKIINITTLDEILLLELLSSFNNITEYINLRIILI